MSTRISVESDITLISLQDIKGEIEVVTSIFEKIAQLKIDVDIISLQPIKGDKTNLSFTINDEDLIQILEHSSDIYGDKINPIVSSGNHIISILDESMDNCPGIAAKALKSICDINADLRVITTSKVQISFLVTQADFQEVCDALSKTFDVKIS